MNKLSKERQTQIISALVEGNSLRATARTCHADPHTVQWLATANRLTQRGRNKLGVARTGIEGLETKLTRK
jgi:hypothetical protein